MIKQTLIAALSITTWATVGQATIKDLYQCKTTLTESENGTKISNYTEGLLTRTPIDSSMFEPNVRAYSVSTITASFGPEGSPLRFSYQIDYTIYERYDQNNQLVQAKLFPCNSASIDNFENGHHLISCALSSRPFETLGGVEIPIVHGVAVLQLVTNNSNYEGESILNFRGKVLCQITDTFSSSN
jgi:hypothetical protein